MSRPMGEPLHPYEVKWRPTLEPEIKDALLAKIVAKTVSGSQSRGFSGPPTAS